MRPRPLLFCLLILTLTATLSFASNPETRTVAGLPLHVQHLDDNVIRLWIGDYISSTATVAMATEKGLLVVDTTGNPRVDAELRQVIADEFGRDDFAVLINTHEHLDHTGGNAAYADCTIVGHELVAAGMQRSPEAQARTINWYTERVAELETELAGMDADTPEAAQIRENLIFKRLNLKVAVEAAPLVPPTKTFADRLVLDMGDTTCELYYIGGMHSSSDIAILVPEHGLLLTGDTMADVWLTDTPGCLASFAARTGVRHDFPLLLTNWNALLARKDDIKTLLPGHWNGELSFAGFEARVQYVEALWNGINEEAEAGAALTDCMAQFDLEARFPALVGSPGCTQGNNGTTIVEIWSEVTDQQSAARALYGLLDDEAPEAEIQKVVAQHGAEPATHFFMETEFNLYGYRFLQTDRAEQAVVMFRINSELYPESWNVYDSLGEGLLATGERDAAIAMYEKSLELNPENENGKTMLERIQSEAAVN